MPDGNRKPDHDAPDPEQLAKLLEIELMQKRAGWQQAKQRRGALRSVSFLFLFLVIIGALLAFWFLFSPDRVQELKENRPRSNEPAPSATTLP
jgi:hypothetical protein